MIVITGLDGIRAEVDGEGGASYTATYKARATRSPAIDSEVKVADLASSVTGFRIGSPWRNDPFALCKRIAPVCVKRLDRRIPTWEWTVDFEFSANVGGPGSPPQGPEQQRDPVLRAPKLSISVETYDKPTLSAAGGAPIKNSAGDPVIRMKKRSRAIFRFSRYMRSWEWQWNQEAPNGFMYSMNASEWSPTGPYSLLLGEQKVPPNKARIESMQTELSAEYGGCVLQDITVKVDLDGFNDKFFDSGFFFLAEEGVTDPGAGRPPVMARQRFVDQGGFTATPQLLNGAGRANAVGADPVELSYNLYLVKEWNISPLKEFFS